MSKWILMPDSFKGTMSSLEICRLMREALLRHVPDAEVVSIPVADGGEGSVEAFLAAMGGHRVEVPCTGPDFRKISGFYGLLADGYTAVIEMAAAAGLPLMEGRLCAEGATTYGVGELILAAIRDGARRIILGCWSGSPLRRTTTLSTIRTRTMTPCSSRPRPRPTTQSRQSSTNRWSGT